MKTNRDEIETEIPDDILLLDLRNDIASVHATLPGAPFACNTPGWRGSVGHLLWQFPEIFQSTFVMRALAQALGRHVDSKDRRYDPELDRITYHGNIAKRRAFLRQAEGIYATIKARLEPAERDHVEACIRSVAARLNAKHERHLRVIDGGARKPKAKR